MIKVLNDHSPTFQYSAFIRRLNFLALGSELTDSMFLRLSHCDRLERLTLVNCSSLSADALAMILPRCPNLVAVDLTMVVETDDRAIVSLAECASRLQGINLTGCKNVTDAGVMALAQNCPMLRRVKLNGVEQVTDGPISALARNCPLLLEIDLNKCKLITDVAIRHIWTYSVHMRELRLSAIPELTDAAFPAPLNPTSKNVFIPTATPDQLPPLIITRAFEHLRMLDLTACALITDEAVQGIVSHAPKIRNLVLSKCVLLTDKSVESICGLGRHLHYLHLGHAAKITDRSVRCLARACTRLRYVDFANCTNLTDMSVFELSSLPKLRRVGLVRVDNLTDESVYALADRHATLERIHLSYCDQISVMAIYFLLQKLHKLTHLSLTGVPAFRQTELQQFCRPPPTDFNHSQRTAFCVYSGKGVSDLRAYLTELFDQITEMNSTDDTEYEDDEDDDNDNDADPPEPMETDEYDPPEEENEPPSRHFAVPPTITVHRGNRQPPSMYPIQQGPSNSNRWTAQLVASSSTAAVGSSSRRQRVAVQLPVVETSHSPPRSPPYSDIASNRSATSNGAGFFRNYQEISLPSPRNSGVLTPDLNYAELGHGRGAATPSIAQNLRQLSQSRTNGSTVSVASMMQPMTFADNQSPADPRLVHHPVQHEASRRPHARTTAMRTDAMVVESDVEEVIPARTSADRGRSSQRDRSESMTAAEQYASSVMFVRGEGSSNARNGQSSGSTSGTPSRRR